jgi:hypothetical protein
MYYIRYYLSNVTGAILKYNTVHKTELGVVLQILLGNLNVLGCKKDS